MAIGASFPPVAAPPSSPAGPNMSARAERPGLFYCSMLACLLLTRRSHD
uniref:Uncharacterized protein n=1 Tax=Arundo donax TaxID=35708 RepID=A0A0A8ZNY8_ARUDO